MNSIRHVIDDGAVFYINGVEVDTTFQYAPDGAIGSTTFPTGVPAMQF